MPISPRLSIQVGRAGEIFTWGDGRAGQLGHGDGKGRALPTLVQPLHGHHVASVACGGAFTVAVGAGGALFAFGANHHGQLGLGDGATIGGGAGGGGGGGAGGGGGSGKQQLLPKAVNLGASRVMAGPDAGRAVAAACGDAHTLVRFYVALPGGYAPSSR